MALVCIWPLRRPATQPTASVPVQALLNQHNISAAAHGTVTEDRRTPQALLSLRCQRTEPTARSGRAHHRSCLHALPFADASELSEDFASSETGVPGVDTLASEARASSGASTPSKTRRLEPSDASKLMTASGAMRRRNRLSSQQSCGTRFSINTSCVFHPTSVASESYLLGLMSSLCPSLLQASTSRVTDRPASAKHSTPCCRFPHSSSRYLAGTRLQQSRSRRRGLQCAARSSRPTRAVLEVSQDSWEAEVLQVPHLEIPFVCPPPPSPAETDTHTRAHAHRHPARVSCARPPHPASRGLANVLRKDRTTKLHSRMVQANKPVLVDFWATWCGPCKLILPSVEWVEQEYGDHLKVVKVEADPNPGLMEKYKVTLRDDACNSPGNIRDYAVCARHCFGGECYQPHVHQQSSLAAGADGKAMVCRCMGCQHCCSSGMVRRCRTRTGRELLTRRSSSHG